MEAELARDPNLQKSFGQTMTKGAYVVIACIFMMLAPYNSKSGGLLDCPTKESTLHNSKIQISFRIMTEM